MRRFAIFALLTTLCVCLIGCTDPTNPAPLTPEQERELQRQMDQVEQEEMARPRE
jgi:hypothetical protein